MKNKIYIFSLINILVITAGCILKLAHIPGASITLLIGFLIFILFTIPLSLTDSYRAEQDKKLKTLYILAYICIFIVCASMLLKILHWPGAYLFMVIAIPIPFVLFLPAFLIQIKKNKKLNFTHLLLALFFFAFFAVITALLSVNVSKNLLEEYRDTAMQLDQQSRLSNEEISVFFEEFKTNHSGENDKKQMILNIQKGCEALYQKIDTLKNSILMYVNSGKQMVGRSNEKYDLSKMEGLDNNSFNYDKGIQMNVSKLTNDILAYKKVLREITNLKNATLNKYIDQMIQVPENFQLINLGENRMIEFIEELNSIKNNIGLSTLETTVAIENQQVPL